MDHEILAQINGPDIASLVLGIVCFTRGSLSLVSSRQKLHRMRGTSCLLVSAVTILGPYGLLYPAINTKYQTLYLISFSCTLYTFIMVESVPLVSSPDDVYPEAVRAAQAQRWEHLESKFFELYGRKADFISRSPGRVNIIGEVSLHSQSWA